MDRLSKMKHVIVVDDPFDDYPILIKDFSQVVVELSSLN